MRLKSKAHPSKDGDLRLTCFQKNIQSNAEWQTFVAMIFNYVVQSLQRGSSVNIEKIFFLLHLRHHILLEGKEIRPPSCLLTLLLLWQLNN